MNKRQLEVQKNNLKEETEILKRLKLIYGQAQDDCVNKIIDLSRRKDMENLQSIIWQKQYQEALNKQLQGVLDDLNTKSFTSIAEYLDTSYENGFFGTLYDLQGQGIPLCFPIDQEQVVKAVQVDSKLSQGLYKHMGEDTGKLKEFIKTELSIGIVNGESWNQIAAHIASGMKSPFTKAYNRAITIARTEGHRVNQEASLHCQQKAKSKGADIVKQWDATLDSVTRPHHLELDQQIREVEEPFEVAGMRAMYPGSFGTPSEDCNCRCCLLQRARWAISAEEFITKYDGDKRELVKIPAKSYNEFKDTAKEVIKEQKSLMGTSSFGELKKYLKDTYDISIESSVESLDFETCKSVLSGMESVFTDYPELSNNIKTVATKNRGVMCCGGDTIYFNPKYFTDVSGFQDMCDRNSKNNWWIPNSTPASIGVHETGHAVERLLLDTDTGYSYDFERIMDWNKGKMSGGIVSQALKNIKKTAYGKGKKNDELMTAVSKYGATEKQETFAEAFADVYANGEKANPLSLEIKKLAGEKFNELKGV